MRASASDHAHGGALLVGSGPRLAPTAPKPAKPLEASTHPAVGGMAPWLRAWGLPQGLSISFPQSTVLTTGTGAGGQPGRGLHTHINSRMLNRLLPILCLRFLLCKVVHACWSLSHVQLWSGLPFPSPGHLPNPGVELASLMSPALAGGFFTTSTTWEAPP